MGICKGMHSLPQSGIISHKHLSQHLNQHRFFKLKFTAGLWLHKQRDISFVLVVDDFRIKFTNLKDAEYLIETLKKKYGIIVDWKGLRHAGFTFKWDYKERTVDI